MLSCCGGVVLWCGRVSSFGRTDGRYVGLLRRAALRRPRLCAAACSPGRHPWARRRWTGPFSVDDARWASCPGLRAAKYHGPAAERKAMRLALDAQGFDVLVTR